MPYFVITVDEDGDVSLEKRNKQELLEDIQDMSSRARERIRYEIPDWMMLDRAATIIIKGEIVTPIQKKVVIEYDIDE